MEIDKIKKKLLAIEKSKSIITKEIDKLRIVHNDLYDLLFDLDNGISDLEEGLSSIESGVDEFSKTL
jgi:predicted  nucleic acid-binding Zn-ribbon protein